MTTSHNSPSGSATSTSWLRLVKAHDAAAWSRLTELYGPLVFHWGRRQGMSPEDAGDLLQEVFAAVAIAIDRFLHSPERGTFRGWLWTIARNKLRDHFRRTANREEADGGTEAQRRLSAISEVWSEDSNELTDQVELRQLFS